MYKLECYAGDNEHMIIESEILPEVGKSFRIASEDYMVRNVAHVSRTTISNGKKVSEGDERIVVYLEEKGISLNKVYNGLVSRGEAKPVKIYNSIRVPSEEIKVSISVEKNKRDKLVELKKGLYHELLMSDYNAMSSIERALMGELSNDEDVRGYYDSMGEVK